MDRAMRIRGCRTSVTALFIALFFIASPIVSILAENAPRSTSPNSIEDAYLPCPGVYCGRLVGDDGIIEREECGACPSGFRSNGFVCVRCDSSLGVYGWLYLLGNAMFVAGVQCALVGHVSSRRLPKRWVSNVSAIAEVLLASLVAILISDPIGTLDLRGCAVHGLSDFYSLFENPSIKYETTIDCTQEAAFPLYRIVLIFTALTLGFMLVLRPSIAKRHCGPGWAVPVLNSLYFLPSFALAHVVLAGLAYYSFPYLYLLIGIVALTHTLIESYEEHSSFMWDVIATGYVAVAFGALSIAFFYGFNRAWYSVGVILGPLLPPAIFIVTRPYTHPSCFT